VPKASIYESVAAKLTNWQRKGLLAELDADRDCAAYELSVELRAAQQRAEEAEAAAQAHVTARFEAHEAILAARLAISERALESSDMPFGYPHGGVE
jgi:hypothetical protein